MVKLLFAVVAGYGLLVAGVYLMQGRMLYLPHVPGRSLDVTPDDVGLDYEDISLATSDGVNIHGWYLPSSSPRTLLFFHGNAGNVSHRLDSLRQFHNIGLSVLIVDYRGYGKSGGRTTEAGIYRDAEAAWSYLVEDRGLQRNEIIVFGRSLGASVAAWLAARRDPLALIVESSFTSVPDMAAEIYPWLPVRLLSRARHATRDYVAVVSCPVLVIHSRDDEIIPFRHGRAIFEAATGSKRFLELRGSHNDAYLRDEPAYLEGLTAFLNQLPTRSAAKPRSQ